VLEIRLLHNAITGRGREYSMMVQLDIEMKSEKSSGCVSALLNNALDI
jgi:hypothetical protein